MKTQTALEQAIANIETTISGIKVSYRHKAAYMNRMGMVTINCLRQQQVELMALLPIEKQQIIDSFDLGKRAVVDNYRTGADYFNFKYTDDGK